MSDENMAKKSDLNETARNFSDWVWMVKCAQYARGERDLHDALNSGTSESEIIFAME